MKDEEMPAAALGVSAEFSSCSGKIRVAPSFNGQTSQGRYAGPIGLHHVFVRSSDPLKARVRIHPQYQRVVEAPGRLKDSSPSRAAPENRHTQAFAGGEIHLLRYPVAVTNDNTCGCRLPKPENRPDKTVLTSIEKRLVKSEILSRALERQIAIIHLSYEESRKE